MGIYCLFGVAEHAVVVVKSEGALLRLWSVVKVYTRGSYVVEPSYRSLLITSP